VDMMVSMLFLKSLVVERKLKLNIKFKMLQSNPLPSVSGATLNISVDTVTSASPYIFNISLRSVYGMCGLHADGAIRQMDLSPWLLPSLLVLDFRKMIELLLSMILQLEHIRIILLPVMKIFIQILLARFKPEYENFHIKCDNDAYLQIVSVFAIGYANHFLADSGGDQSINNSNSNFGAKALTAKGFRVLHSQEMMLDILLILFHQNT
jgi:hypothetical protein